MLEPLSAVLLGFFLGIRHATDPDHVIAVTTIVTRLRSARSAALIGLLWGIGHTLTILAVGSAIVLFEVVIPPRLGLGMEFSVALMLIGLGVWNVRGVFRRRAMVADAHSHAHRHGDYVHTHDHGHGPGTHGHADDATPQARLDRAFGRLGLYQVMRPLVAGIVHGLAGSATIALLVLATIRDPGWAIAYLLVFGLGTIAGMLVITVTISVPLAFTTRRLVNANRYLALASGLVSLGFGAFLAYQIGFVDGLLTGRLPTP
jgi:ABC-type nickel/cobalt efflux system permease component RcnA